MPATLIAEATQHNDSATSLLLPSTLAAPLPRLTSPPKPSPNRYEVLVVGAGPSGLMLSMMLTRYGLASTSVLCIDARPQQTFVGNADGVNGRTLEILGQMGLESRILRDGMPFSDIASWSRVDNETLTRKMVMPWHMAPARYQQLVAIHQGHVESIFREDMVRYGGQDVQYSTKLVTFKLDEAGNADFPVVTTIEKNGVTQEVRTKYLIGADGARSTVRNFMGVEMEGNKTDELWGVIDLVVDTDFPDIRRVIGIYDVSENSSSNNDGVNGGFTVPRERLANGDYLTRLYLDMTVDVKESNENKDLVSEGQAAENQQNSTAEKGKRIDEALILDRATKLFHPFKFEVKKGTKVHWWAAFRISQTLAKSFTLKDSASHPRVFIVGDACHSHSPRQGQGMNVSIQDSYNLAWKLAYNLFGLDASKVGSDLLNSYEEERIPNARNLVGFDKRMNQMRKTREEKWAELKQFSTSCGVEYGEGLGVSRAGSDREGKSWTSIDYLEGVVYPGRRLLNVKLKNFASGEMRDIHDELRAEGRFSVVVIAGDDFGKDERSTRAADAVCKEVIKVFPPGLVQPILLQPQMPPEFEWKDLPGSIKEEAEMSLFNASEEVYKTYGIESTGNHAGALIVVRPDGVVGMMAELEEREQVTAFIRRMLRGK